MERRSKRTHKPPARYANWYGLRMLMASRDRQISSQQASNPADSLVSVSSGDQNAIGAALPWQLTSESPEKSTSGAVSKESVANLGSFPEHEMSGIQVMLPGPLEVDREVRAESSTG